MGRSWEKVIRWKRVTQRPQVTSNGQDIVLGHRNILEENSKILGGSSFSLVEEKTHGRPEFL